MGTENVAGITSGSANVGFMLAHASHAHIPGIAEIERLCFAEPWSEASFAEEFSYEFARYFVSLAQDGVVLGYCGYWRIVDEAHVTNMAVRPSAQRRGIGRELMRLLLNDAVGRGLRVATLEVREDNDPAIALYKLFGFVCCGIRKNYYPKERKNAIIMTSNLLAAT